jgi:hypothetical protein
MVEVMPASLAELVGYAASALVLATFCFSNPVCFRICALAASITFIAFGSLASVYPVLALHLVLLPVNAYHLARLILARHPEREWPTR